MFKALKSPDFVFYPPSIDAVQSSPSGRGFKKEPLLPPSGHGNARRSGLEAAGVISINSKT